MMTQPTKEVPARHSGKSLSLGERRRYLCAWCGEWFTHNDRQEGSSQKWSSRCLSPLHARHLPGPPLSRGDCSWWAGQSFQARRSSARETSHHLTECCVSCFPWSLSTVPGARGNLIGVYCHESKALSSCDEVRQLCFSRQKKSTCCCLDSPRMEHSTALPTVLLSLLF